MQVSESEVRLQLLQVISDITKNHHYKLFLFVLRSLQTPCPEKEDILTVKCVSLTVTQKEIH